MLQRLKATIQAATQSEIEGMIDPIRLAQIKQVEEDPTFRVYSLGHEGKADLNMPGIGRKTVAWIQAAVQWVSDALIPGTKVFDAHDPNTNSHEGRIQIGEVVGKAVRHIGDRVNALAAIYIFPQFKSRPLDFASIEAEIVYDNDGTQVWPTAIQKVTGIALGNSKVASPGIPGATLLGAVQAYAVQAFAGEGKDKIMNQSDVKAAVLELKLKPSDIFSVEEVVADKGVRTNLQEAATRVGKERDTARERVAELENINAEKDKTIQQKDIALTQSTSTSVIEAILADPECKLGDQAKAFVLHNSKNFSTEATDGDALKVDAAKFVAASAAESGVLADLYGVKQNPNIPASFVVDNNKPPGAGPVVKQPEITPSREAVNKEEMNPDTNPLIAGGKAAIEVQTQ